MAHLTVTVVAADYFVWEGQAKSVTAKTPNGTIGVLASHTPILATLESSIISIESIDEGKVEVQVSGGFFLMDSSHVEIVANDAKLLGEKASSNS